MFKIASFVSTNNTLDKYFPKDIIVHCNGNENDLYTEIGVILSRSMVAIKKAGNEYIVYAKKNDPNIWGIFKMKLMNTYFTN